MSPATHQAFEARIDEKRTAYAARVDRAINADAVLPDWEHMDAYVLAWELREEFKRLEAIVDHFTGEFTRRPDVPVPAER
jgi:hypothetical protein